MTVSIEIRPRMHGFNASLRNALARLDGQTNRPPGPLDEYPSRAAHARAHRLRSEIRRRDRRRARTGRAPIQLRGRARPRMLEITNALAPLGPAFERVGQAARQFTDAAGPAMIAMQQRINEIVQAIATATVPHRFTAGTAPEWTAYDDVAAWGGFVSPPRDPDDDTILAFVSPGEVHVPPAALERYGPGLFQRLNGPGPTYVYPLAEDDTHSVGAQNERDFRAVARTLGPPLGELPNAATWRGDVTHHDRYLGEGNLDRDETSSVHSTDSSGTGAVWTDLMTRIDDLVDGED